MRTTLFLLITGSLMMLTACADATKTDGKAAVKPVLPGSVMAIRVNAGADKDFTDKANLKWMKDQEYKVGAWGRVGGDTVGRPASLEIKKTYAPELYRDEAYGMKAYRFTLPNGMYTVQLHFAETFEGITAAGQRVFSVSIEGKPVLTDLDLFKAVGPNTAMIKAYDVKLVDGVLDIEFTAKEQAPLINGIEILQP